MFKAQDGKAFGNHEQGRHYDKTRKKPSHTADRMEKANDIQQQPEQEQDMGQVVAEHGPATHMEMHSHHEDGHVHKATHHDHMAAHDHVSKAFGQEHEQHEPAPMMSGGGEGAIPTMG